MTTSTTPISLAGTAVPVSVAQELGLGLTTAITMNDPVVRTLAAAGGTGTAISMSGLQAKTNRISLSVAIAASAQNYLLNTAKAAGYIAGKTDLTVTINSGIIIGSATPAGISFDVDTSWAAGDTINIVNNGSILGCGGAGGIGGGAGAVGNGGAGGTGGTALRVQRQVSLSNVGTIAGGGGGGGGGSGGNFASTSGGGGGGGAGNAVGLGAGPGPNGTAGQGGTGANGTQTTGGAGGAAPTNGSNQGGGAGGALGSPGLQNTAPAPGGNAVGGAAGNCTTAGSNANITWNALGTRLGTIA